MFNWISKLNLIIITVISGIKYICGKKKMFIYGYLYIGNRT